MVLLAVTEGAGGGGLFLSEMLRGDEPIDVRMGVSRDYDCWG